MFKVNQDFPRVKRQLIQEGFELLHDVARPAKTKISHGLLEMPSQHQDAEYGVVAIHASGVLAVVWAETWRDHVEVKLFTTVIQRLPMLVNWRFITDISITNISMSHRSAISKQSSREEMISRPPCLELMLDLNYFLYLESPETSSKEVHNTVGHAMKWIQSWASFDYWKPHWYSHSGHFDLSLVKTIMQDAPQQMHDKDLDHFGFTSCEALRLIERIPPALYWRFMHPLREMDCAPEDMKAQFEKYSMS